MLVLSRKSGEGIHIDGNIKVTIIKAGPHRVKIGIEAPDNVRILRSELDNWSELSFEVPAPSNPCDDQPLDTGLPECITGGYVI